MTPEQLFSDLLAAEPARPFVTYYDEATGERAELSVRSLANWVAKTHFLLIDELGLGVGDAAFIALPAHWISVPAVLGCLTAGLALTTDRRRGRRSRSSRRRRPASPPASRTSTRSRRRRPRSGSRDEVPDGVSDYVVAVRPQADAWAGVQLGGRRRPTRPRRRAAAAEVVADARARADELGVAAGARLLTTRDWAGPADWIDTLLVPLVVGGSIVYVRNAPDDELVARRMQQERATVRV